MIKRDNGRDHRVRTVILQAEKTARKPDFACIALLSADLTCDVAANPSIVFGGVIASFSNLLVNVGQYTQLQIQQRVFPV